MSYRRKKKTEHHLKVPQVDLVESDPEEDGRDELLNQFRREISVITEGYAPPVSANLVFSRKVTMNYLKVGIFKKD